MLARYARAMRLTLFTDYAFRSLIFLGLKGEESGRIREIAEHYGISEHHLTKVVQKLARAGFVKTLRGRGGGLRLARPAAEIGVGAVVRAVEDDLALVECFTPAGACVIRRSCGLKGVLGEALGAFLAVLDRYTLADLLVAGAELRTALRLDRPAGDPAAPVS
jgi:Rrf2 family transcriptional regulator, nitric oxide-sensitive transcriptional repressor